MAKGAFFHNPSHPGRDLGSQVAIHSLILGKYVPPVEIPRAVGAGSLAVPAADTSGIYLADDPGIEIQFRGSGNTDGNTRWVMVAVHARPGKITDLSFGELLSVGYLVKTHPGDRTFFI